LKFNPEIHYRRSLRLKGYNYANCGAYFVTMCAQNRECLFGDIVAGVMQINKYGLMIQKWWMELPNKFKNVEMNTYMIMPNHLHGIISIVGADRCVCPDRKYADSNKGAHTGAPLHRIVQWFKTMSTNEYLRNIYEKGWQRLNGKLWQRNYYDHIIRNETELDRIRQYIINNPSQWDNDENNPAHYRKDDF